MISQEDGQCKTALHCLTPFSILTTKESESQVGVRPAILFSTLKKKYSPKHWAGYQIIPNHCLSQTNLSTFIPLSSCEL